MSTEVDHWRFEKESSEFVKNESVPPGEIGEISPIAIMAICSVENSSSTLAIKNGQRATGVFFESYDDIEGQEFVMPDNTQMVHLYNEEYVVFYFTMDENERAIQIYHHREEDDDIENAPRAGDLIEI